VATSERSDIGRRQAIRTLASGAVAAVASASWVESLTALARQQAHTHAAVAVIAAQNWAPRTLTAHQNDLVVALAELIIPQTDTPGAKGANVNRFIDQVLTDAQPAVRESFVRGLTWIDTRSRALSGGKDFMGASAEQQTTLLSRLSAEGNPNKEEAIGRDFFQAIKSMTINGYYTSEIGLRQELGDSGQLFLPQFQGCDHKEHQ
jgi:glucoside 3-dehydrogenase (cytochrome c) hitch-hiker subunit